MKPFKNRQDDSDENAILKGHLACMQHFPTLRRDHFPWSLKNFGMSTKDLPRDGRGGLQAAGEADVPRNRR